MTREEIDDVVFDIMRTDGPDGHVDGHDIITDFIMAVVEGKGKEWAEYYNSEELAKKRNEDQDESWRKMPETLRKFASGKLK